MASFKDSASMLANVLGEFKTWYTKVNHNAAPQDKPFQCSPLRSPSSNFISPNITCDKFPKYNAIIELTGRVMRENIGTWSTSVKRNIEVAFCVTGLGDGECYLMLLDDPNYTWVWNAVKQLSTSLIPAVRRLVVSLFYRFEQQPEVVRLILWVLSKDQDFVCRYYCALCVTKSPVIAYHVDEGAREDIVSLVFRDEYCTKAFIHDREDLQRKINGVFTRCAYPENMLVENAKINRGN